MEFIYHHRTAGRGGEGVHITSVVRALQKAGHDVEIVSPPGVDPMNAASAVPLDKGAKDASGLGRLWKWVSCSCPQFVFEALEIAYNATAVARLAPVLRRRRAAVYYERYAFFLVAGVWLAKLFGRRVILEVNEVVGVHRARSQFFVALAKWFERLTFAKADEIITVSSYLRREVLRRGGRDGHVHVVPNAIDPTRFGPGRGAEVRARLGLEGTTVIGFVGWFDRWDRLDRLVDLVKALGPTYPSVRLLLVGDGPVAHDLAASIEQHRLEQLVVLSGPVARATVPDYIDAMDICILPDSNEFGSPIVLFEFMAMGKAVVAPDVEPIRDVLTDGENGWIVNRRDDVGLKTVVTRLLDDPAHAKRAGAAARQQVFEQHTWSAVGAFVVTLAARQLEATAAGREAAAEA